MLILTNFSGFLLRWRRRIDGGDAHLTDSGVKGQAHRFAAFECLAKKLPREERLNFESDLALAFARTVMRLIAAATELAETHVP